MGFSQSLTKDTGDVKITLNAPRQVPLIEHTSQFIPKKPSIPIKIRAINTRKSPSEMIFNVPKFNRQGELPPTLIDFFPPPSYPTKSKCHQKPL
jgi:hypothetical protein